MDGCLNPRKDGAAKKVGTAFAWTSAALSRRTLGGQRRLGDKPCQGRQPPEAGAKGPPLQGSPCSQTSSPGRRRQLPNATQLGNFKPAVFGAFRDAANTPQAGSNDRQFRIAVLDRPASSATTADETHRQIWIRSQIGKESRPCARDDTAALQRVAGPSEARVEEQGPWRGLADEVSYFFRHVRSWY